MQVDVLVVFVVATITLKISLPVRSEIRLKRASLSRSQLQQLLRSKTTGRNDATSYFDTQSSARTHGHGLLDTKFTSRNRKRPSHYEDSELLQGLINLIKQKDVQPKQPQNFLMRQTDLLDHPQVQVFQQYPPMDQQRGYNSFGGYKPQSSGTSSNLIKQLSNLIQRPGRPKPRVPNRSTNQGRGLNRGLLERLLLDENRDVQETWRPKPAPNGFPPTRMISQDYEYQGQSWDEGPSWGGGRDDNHSPANLGDFDVISRLLKGLESSANNYPIPSRPMPLQQIRGPSGNYMGRQNNVDILGMIGQLLPSDVASGTQSSPFGQVPPDINAILMQHKNGLMYYPENEMFHRNNEDNFSPPWKTNVWPKEREFEPYEPPYQQHNIEQQLRQLLNHNSGGFPDQEQQFPQQRLFSGDQKTGSGSKTGNDHQIDTNNLKALLSLGLGTAPAAAANSLIESRLAAALSNKTPGFGKREYFDRLPNKLKKKRHGKLIFKFR